METMNNLLYSKDHEWLKVEGNEVTVGITDYAQHALGEVVFVELPDVGQSCARESVLSVVESVKAASEVYSPVSGTVLRVNEILTNSPELLNSQPYDSWIAVLELADPAQLDDLLDETAYAAFCAQEDA
jgi:glycine cleavage system H protein